MKNLAYLFLIFGIVSCGADNNTIVTEKLTETQSNDIAKIEVTAEYPKTGDEYVLNAVRRQVADMLLPNYQGSLADGRAILKQFVQKESSELTPEGYVPEAPYTYTADISVAAQTPNFITIEKNAYVYTGGAHGMPMWQAVTVNKNDGQLINDNILNDNVNSYNFKQLLKQGVTTYFTTLKGAVYQCEFQPQKLSEEVFADYDVNNLPLPVTKPFLTDSGVGFAYMQYELASYADGMIAFVIPYAKMQPYMSSKAWSLVEQKQKDNAEISAFVSENLTTEYQKYSAMPEHKVCD